MSQEDNILSGEEQDDLNASLELDLGTPIKVTKQNYKDLVFLIKGAAHNNCTNIIHVANSINYVQETQKTLQSPSCLIPEQVGTHSAKLMYNAPF